MLYYDRVHLENRIEILRRHFGSHRKVAYELGITPDHYRKVRNKRTVMSICLRRFIFTLAEKVDVKKIKMIKL